MVRIRYEGNRQRTYKYFFKIGTGMPRICEDEEDKKEQRSAAKYRYKRNDSLRPPTNGIGRNVSAVQLKSLRLVLYSY